MAYDHRALFFTAQVLSTVALLSVAIGQQVGVSLKLQGVTIPNNSLVDFDDLLYRTNHEPELEDPSNNNTALQDKALLCVTDLVDCCDSPHTVRGDWYYPNGSRVLFDGFPLNLAFRRNRGPNEIKNKRQFYGSVRLWRRFNPKERGRFRCELPSAADPSVNQTLYANILSFGYHHDIDKVTISPSTGSSTAGRTDYSLTCSSTLRLFEPVTLPTDVASPNFQWYFNVSASLPSGVTAMATVMSSSNSTSKTYTSILQFFPLSQSYTGMYTCQLGAGRLVNNVMIVVNAPTISAMVTANLNTPLMVGQTGNTLTCDVSGAERLNPVITYQWTRNGGTVLDSNSRTLDLSPLQLSQAGNYTCHATISSALLNNDITISTNNQNLTIQIPDTLSVSLTSSSGTTVINGSDVTINCAVEFSPAVTESELSLLMADAQLFMLSGGATRNLSLTNQAISGTTLTFTTVVNSFGRSDSGNYSCVATIRSSSIYINGTLELSNEIQVTTGVYFSSRSNYVNTNSNILITDIGEGDCGALLCYTDLKECCHDRALGQWLYPNGSVVGTRSSRQEFYIDRGPSVVHLNRRSNATSTIATGQFCCVIPDATSTNTRICINVVAPQSKQAAIVTSEGVAVGVGATIFIECIIGALIIAMLLLCKKRRKPTENIYKLTKRLREFKSRVKKHTCELSSKTVCASNGVQGRRVRDFVYERTDHYKMAIAKSPIQGGEVGEETYEALDPDIYMQDNGEDNAYVITDNMAAAMQEDGENNAYYVVTDNMATGMQGDGEDDAYVVPDYIMQGDGAREDTYEALEDIAYTADRGGVRESGLYDEPDNTGARSTSLRVKYELH